MLCFGLCWGPKIHPTSLSKPHSKRQLPRDWVWGGWGSH